MAKKLINSNLLPKRYVVTMGSYLVFASLTDVAIALDALERSIGKQEYLNAPNDWDVGDGFYAQYITDQPEVAVVTTRIGTLEETRAVLVSVDVDDES